MKLIKSLLPLVFTLFFGQVFSQQRFDITVTLDSSINSRNVKCYYENGTDFSPIIDTFINNTLNIIGDYYSKFVSFRIDYYGKENSLSGNFFIGDKPAKIHLSEKNNSKKSQLAFDSIKNAKLVFDTINNKIWQGLLDVYKEKEVQSLSDFYEKHGSEIDRVDSITLQRNELFKFRNNRAIQFLKNYRNDYFSFWVFKVQILAPSLVFMSTDTTYMRSLLLSFYATFPDVFTKSYEGIKVVEKLEGLIKAQEANLLALSFSMNDSLGKKIDLNDFKGKYILLDFWASWCVPCRMNNPILKTINNKYQNVNFKLLSISADTNADYWKDAILKDSMNWTNLSDLQGMGSDIAMQYGIKAYPTYILIDPSGKIIYRSENEIDKVQKKMEEIFKIEK